MHAQSTSRISLPSHSLQSSLPAAFDPTPLQPVSFFPSGSEIYAQGEKAGAFYQVEFGGVRICRLLADGRRQISAFHLAGVTFGFEADTTHHFFAEAINATGVRVIRFATGANISRWRNCYFVDFSNVLESFFGKSCLATSIFME